MEILNAVENEPVKCHWRCPTAKSRICHCSCNGKNHGMARTEPLTPQMDLVNGKEDPMFEPRKGFITGHMASRCVWIDEKLLNPAPSQRVWNHSPDGFCWGYGGSGPAQLGLALMLHFESKDWAVEHYQDFKWDVIARLPQGDFQIPVSTVTDWIRQKKTRLPQLELADA